MTYSSEVLADSPAAYYRLGDASGAMTDSSGNGRNGTYSNVTLGTTGLLTGDADTAITINHSEGRGEVTDAAWMDTGTTLTVEAWIKTSTTGVYQYIVNRDTTGRLWCLRLTNTGVLQVEKIVGTFAASTGTTALNDGARHHVAFTYDGSNIRLYVDGALEQTTAATGSLDGTAILGIGSTYAGTGTWGPHRFIGVMDEVAYYGTTLSGTRIAAHYAAGTSTGITVSLDRFTSAATMRDVSATTFIEVAVDRFTAAATMLDVAIPNVTDVSNELDGRLRSGSGTVTITRPVTAPPASLVLAEAYDKAMPYPTPTMVDGRPT